MYHHYVVSKNWQRLPRNEMHYRPNHAWLCERNNTFRSSFCLTISRHIILWIFSFFVLLIHYPKITRLKREGESESKSKRVRDRSIQIILFSVRIVFWEKERPFLVFFHLVHTFLMGKGYRPTARNAKEIAHLYFQKVFLYFQHWIHF